MERSRHSLRRLATPLDCGRPLGSAMKNGQLCNKRQRATCLSLVVVVVVVVRTCSLICVSVHTYQQYAPNYGSRVPVDTAPGPVPVHRALKNHPISSSPPGADQPHDATETVSSGASSICRSQRQARERPVSTQKDELQLWDLDCLLANCTRTCWTFTPGRGTPCQ